MHDRNDGSGGALYAGIYYDSNNTAFYTDPASTSVLNNLTVSGTFSYTGTPASGFTLPCNIATGRSSYGRANANLVLLADSTYGAACIDFRSGVNYPSDGAQIYYETATNGVSGETSRLVIRTENDADDSILLRGGFIQYQSITVDGGSSNPGHRFVYGGTDRMFVYSDNTTEFGSFRAPIFYDSNDTTYYTDPASGSRFGVQVAIAGNASGSVGNRLLVGSTTVNYSIQDGNLRPTIHAHGAYPVLSLNHTVTSNTNHGPTIQFTSNGVGNQFVIGTDGAGTQLDMGYSSATDWNPHNGIAGYQGVTFFRATSSGLIGLGAQGDWGALGGGNPGYAIDTRGTLYNNTDVRAPIFYDSNNTGFYADLASTSNINRITNDTNQRFNIHFRGTPRSDITSDQNYWTTTQGWGTGYGTWDTAWQFGFGGFDFWGSSTGHPQGSGYIHAQGIQSGLHYATADGSNAYGWQIVGAADATANRYWARGKWGTSTSAWKEFAMYGTTGVGGSQSASIYYDSDNSAYFCDPAGRSRLASMDYGNGGYYFAGGDWGYRHNTPFGWIQFGPANSSHAHIYTDRPNFYLNAPIQVNGSSIMNTSDIRATIFYDQNDTGYYVDPNSTSTVKQLRVAARVQTANYYDAAIEVREFNYGGVQADSTANYPRIGFHWGGRVASSIAMSSNGWINIMNNPGTGYENLIAAQGLFTSEVTAYYSDIRLKTKVGSLDNAVEKVKAIETFKYVNNELANSFGFTDTDVHVGVSAQSVEAVLPEIVRHAPFDMKSQDGETISASGEWYKTVQYDKLVPLLIEAIKEQQTTIDQLRADMQELKEFVKQSLGK
jgi:hypothetical protein